MKNLYLVLAWRNIWRNKRRSFLTMSVIALAIVIVLGIKNMYAWMFDYQIDNSIASYVGYVQVTDTTYVDEQIIDNSFSLDGIDIPAIENIPKVTAVIERMQSGALVSTGIKSKYAGIISIEPSRDNEALNLDRILRKGELLKDGDDGILITETMARFYQVEPGDTLILMGSGYQGNTAAGLFKIQGIIDYSVGEMSTVVMMPLKSAQHFLVADDRYTHLLINTGNSKDIPKILPKIKELFADRKDLVVRPWQEVQPEFAQLIEFSQGYSSVIAAILYLVVGFGIFGTVVMMANERIYEFGVMVAIGMNKMKLLFTSLVELFILTCLGLLLGLSIILPIMYYLNLHPAEITGEAAEGAREKGFEPLIGMNIDWDIILTHMGLVLLMTGVISIYYILKILKLRPVEAMKGN